MSETAHAFPRFIPFHTAFVTQKLEQGMETFGRMYGRPEFTIHRQAEVQTPGGIAYLDLAFTDFNGTQYEIMEPKGGHDRIYREALPAVIGATRLHHVASYIQSWEDWQDLIATIEQSGLATPAKGIAESAGATYHYVYIDVRKQLGHYLEFVYQAD